VISVLRSLAFYIVFYGISVPWAMAAAISILFGQRAVRVVADGWSALHLACTRHILGVKIRIEGERPDYPALYAAKHESFFDAINMPMLLNFPSVFGKEELFRLPFWGKAAQVYGMVPVAREQGAKALRSMMAIAKQRAAEGRPLVIFPEGTRIPHGERPPLRSGFAGLYKLLGLPVVPIAIDSGPAYQPKWVKQRRSMTIRFCKPIPPGLPREEIEARVHEAINELNG
jgi:1-acyl-sn-glycerol-3-phosphate acyltransferase